MATNFVAGLPAAPFASPDRVTFIANMLAVWLFGENVEARLGHVRFLLFAVAGALVGSFAPEWLGRPPLEVPMGASAAAGATVAAYLALYRSSRVLVLAWLITTVDAIEVPVFFFAGLWLLAQAFRALGPFMDTIGVLLSCAGGAAWGLVAVWVLRRPVDWSYTPGKTVTKA